MVRSCLRFAVQSCLVFAALLLFHSSSAFGQSGNPFFVPPTFPGSEQAISADVNGDGKPDLVFFDGTVLLGKGDGTFTTGTPWRNPATSPNLTASLFAIADFNGDGKPDILAAGPVNLLSVMLGNGDGTFQSAVTTSIAAPASTFVVGDMNGDGKPDVLAQVGSAFFSYLGKGDGTFAAGVTSNANSASQSDLLVDFNGDGKADLFVFNQAVLQLGNGDGTFQAPVQLPFGTPALSGLIGDFDGDGKLDIMGFFGTSTSRQVQILFGNGDGTFRAGAMQPFTTTSLGDLTIVDLNGDGKADLVGSTGSALQVLIGKGDGTFTPDGFYNAPNLLPNGSNGSNSIVVADFNSDGKKDVAAFNTMLLGNGDGTLQGNATVPGAFGFSAMGDFNGDGHQDFASVGPIQQSTTNSSVYQASLNIWLNDGKNNFTLANTYEINLPAPDLADLTGIVGFGTTADVNGDGKIDLVGYRADGSGLSMLVLLGNGDGTFGAPLATNVSSVSGDRLLELGFALGDLNGDGKPDLIVNAGNGPNPSTLSIFLGNGDGTFRASGTPFVGGSIGVPVVGDFNGDKKMDVITGSANGLAVLLGNGDGTFQPTTFITSASCGTACGTPVSADFNADGKLDLMLAAVGGYQVLLGNGDGTFNILPAVSAGTFSGFFQVADFNGDGKLDVLGSIGSTNLLGLILGKGDGTFGSPLPVTNAGYPFVADFNGDNKLDILEVDVASSGVPIQLVWLFNMASAVTPPPPTAPDFNVGSGSGSGTATVTAGSTATYPLSLVGSGGFSGSVALTCSVAPAGPACTVAPSSVMVSGSAAATATVSVTTTARSGLLPIGGSNQRDSSRRILWILGALLAAAASVVGLFAGMQKHPRRFSWSLATACGAILLFSVSLIGGCGGGSNSGGGSSGTEGGTTAGNYTVTVTAQSGAVSHKTQLTLTVQ